MYPSVQIFLDLKIWIIFKFASQTYEELMFAPQRSKNYFMSFIKKLLTGLGKFDP